MSSPMSPSTSSATASGATGHQAAKATRPARWRIVVQALVIAVGLAIAVWGTVRLTHITIKCRGVVMHPGDVCRTSGFSQLNADKVMSYELLRRQTEVSQPFVIGAGLLVAAFGVLLLVQQVRRSRAASTDAVM